MSKLDLLGAALAQIDVVDLLKPSAPDAPLLERLRNPPSVYSPVALREEAAEEIERLRALLKQAQKDKT